MGAGRAPPPTVPAGTGVEHRRAGRGAARLDRDRPVRADGRRRPGGDQGPRQGTSRRGTPSRSSRRARRGTGAARRRRGARRQVAVDLRGSVPWPWYAGQRLGVLPPAGRRADHRLPARRDAPPFTADAWRRGRRRRVDGTCPWCTPTTTCRSTLAGVGGGREAAGPRPGTGRGLLRLCLRVRQPLRPRHRAYRDRAAAAARPWAARAVPGSVERRRPGPVLARPAGRGTAVGGTPCRRAGRSSCRSAGSARRSARTCSSRRREARQCSKPQGR